MRSRSEGVLARTSRLPVFFFSQTLGDMAGGGVRARWSAIRDGRSDSAIQKLARRVENVKLQGMHAALSTCAPASRRNVQLRGAARPGAHCPLRQLSAPKRPRPKNTEGEAPHEGPGARARGGRKTGTPGRTGGCGRTAASRWGATTRRVHTSRRPGRTAEKVASSTRDGSGVPPGSTRNNNSAFLAASVDHQQRISTTPPTKKDFPRYEQGHGHANFPIGPGGKRTELGRVSQHLFPSNRGPHGPEGQEYLRLHALAGAGEPWVDRWNVHHARAARKYREMPVWTRDPKATPFRTGIRAHAPNSYAGARAARRRGSSRTRGDATCYAECHSERPHAQGRGEERPRPPPPHIPTDDRLGGGGFVVASAWDRGVVRASAGGSPPPTCSGS